MLGIDWPEDLAEVIYIDGFGNAVTGIRAATVAKDTLFTVARVKLGYARTFSQANIGDAFWYENSMGLIELAVNQGSAAERFNLTIGSSVGWGK
jgi:S-adenosylmethionine hydrolase